MQPRCPINADNWGCLSIDGHHLVSIPLSDSFRWSGHLPWHWKCALRDRFYCHQILHIIRHRFVFICLSYAKYGHHNGNPLAIVRLRRPPKVSDPRSDRLASEKCSLFAIHCSWYVQKTHSLHHINVYFTIHPLSVALYLASPTTELKVKRESVKVAGQVSGRLGRGRERGKRRT